MQPLDLDYQRKGGRRTAEFLLVGLAAAYAAHTGYSYYEVRERLALEERRAARQESVENRVSQPRVEIAAEELLFARKTIRELTTPWSSLFRSLEGVSSDDVALLAIEPDQANRTVNVAGEARDYLALLGYLARLREQPGFARMHLSRHEVKQADPHRPVAFTLTGTWRDER
jgi:hypothetical protein